MTIAELQLPLSLIISYKESLYDQHIYLSRVPLRLPHHKSIFDSREEASQLEIHLHMLYDVGCNPYFYNKTRATSSGFCMYGTKASLKTRKKLSEAHTGKTHSPETRMKISEGNTGKIVSLDTRMKLSKAMTGRGLGRTLTPEHKQKISKAMTGQGLGRTLTPETRMKLSESSKGKNKGTVTVKGLDGKCFRINVNDPRFISREVRGHRAIIIQIQNIQSGEIINHWKSDPLPGGFILLHPLFK